MIYDTIYEYKKIINYCFELCYIMEHYESMYVYIFMLLIELIMEFLIINENVQNCLQIYKINQTVFKWKFLRLSGITVDDSEL